MQIDVTVDFIKQETLSWVFKICVELNYIITITQRCERVNGVDMV